MPEEYTKLAEELQTFVARRVETRLSELRTALQELIVRHGFQDCGGAGSKVWEVTGALRAEAVRQEIERIRADAVTARAQAEKKAQSGR